MELTVAPPLVRLPPQLTPASVDAVADALRLALESPSRVVTITGADQSVFCTGLAIGGDAGSLSATRAFAAVLSALAAAPKPTIAIVDGAAVGGGVGLAAACDWVIATPQSTFGLPELLWGVIPAMIWPFLTARMSERTAMRWTLAAHARSVSDALSSGLVDDAVQPEQLDAAAARAARRLSRLDPEALVQLRRWTRVVRQQDLDRALVEGAALTAAMAADPRVRARWDAFEAGEAPWRE